MPKKLIIRIIGYTEVVIGLTTFFGVITYSLLSISQKSIVIFIFVIASSIISAAIGLNLLRYKEWARSALVFFSLYIILTKVLIFLGLVRFTGELLTLIPVALKDAVSLLYHGLVVVFLRAKGVKNIFLTRGEV